MCSSSDWPKSWEEIRDDSGESGLSRFQDTWVEYSDGLRGYRGTLYASITLGQDVSKNEDEWLPLDAYIEYKIQEMGYERNNS